MKNTLSIALSALFAATLFYCIMSLFVIPHNAKKCAFNVGQTESFAKIESVLLDAEFSKNQLKQYIRATEYIESPRKRKIAYLNALFYVAFFA